jgi:hypothetical protein
MPFGRVDVSPAVRDYLGFNPLDLVDWLLVEKADVSVGPWSLYDTTEDGLIQTRLARAAFLRPKRAGRTILVESLPMPDEREFPMSRH